MLGAFSAAVVVLMAFPDLIEGRPDKLLKPAVLAIGLIAQAYVVKCLFSGAAEAIRLLRKLAGK